MQRWVDSHQGRRLACRGGTELEDLKPSDFPSLGSDRPVFSRRAVEGLWDLLEPNGEILPLLCDEGDYFAYNVTTLTDALDEERSLISRYSDGQIIDVKKYVFQPERMGDAAVFKLTQTPRMRVFVTQGFIERVQELGLAGFEFKLVWDSAASEPSGPEAQDPQVDTLRSDDVVIASVAHESQVPSPSPRARIPANWTPPVPLFGGVPVDRGLIQLIEESGLARPDQLVALMRPSVRFVATRMEDDEIPVGCSKLGGAPDLGQGMEWPQMEGTSLTFLAQVNLTEVAALGITGPLPPEGMLYFFYADPKKHIAGLDPSDRDGFRVLFYPGRVEDLARTVIPADVPMRGRYRPCALEGMIDWKLPPLESEQIECLGLNEQERDLYFDLESRVSEYLGGDYHRFLGYPDQIQGSVASDCQVGSTGLDWDDPACFDEALKWTLLIQITTETVAGMVWDDYGYLYYCIREDDLRELAFDRAWMVLQCT